MKRIILSRGVGVGVGRIVELCLFVVLAVCEYGANCRQTYLDFHNKHGSLPLCAEVVNIISGPRNTIKAYIDLPSYLKISLISIPN